MSLIVEQRKSPKETILEKLHAWLNEKDIAVSSNYLQFIASTGEPHSVILQEETLILSGSMPGAPIHRFTDDRECARHIRRLTSPLVVFASIIRFQNGQSLHIKL